MPYAMTGHERILVILAGFPRPKIRCSLDGWYGLSALSDLANLQSAADGGRVVL